MDFGYYLDGILERCMNGIKTEEIGNRDHLRIIARNGLINIHSVVEVDNDKQVIRLYDKAKTTSHGKNIYSIK